MSGGGHHFIFASKLDPTVTIASLFCDLGNALAERDCVVRNAIGIGGFSFAFEDRGGSWYATLSIQPGGPRKAVLGIGVWIPRS